MRKVLVVALREYNAAVRTKAFVIGLVMMPVLMGGSILAQGLMKDDGDKRRRTIAVIDRTPKAVLLSALQEAFKDGTSRGIQLEEVQPAEDDVEALKRELNGKIRQGKITGWLMIGPDVARLAPPTTEEEAARARVVYKSGRPADQGVLEAIRRVLTAEVLRIRAGQAGLSPEKVRTVSRELRVEREWDPSMAVPFALMMLMFMLIMMAATPLMQGVVEEKMQRIAEVLLGSVSPFRLMLGKLIGMTGVSLTIAAVYLGGAYWGAHRYGFAEYAPWTLILWFILFQTLAALMYGALFIAVGAACTDMRETQSLMWPVMMLAVFPMFFLGPLLRSPDSPVIIGLSYFPFATPSLMIARQGLPSGVQWWEPLLGAAGMLVTTLLCVWAAGRIFRVGILLMGKGASVREIARWVFRG